MKSEDQIMWIKWHHDLHLITGDMAKTAGNLSREQILAMARELERIAQEMKDAAGN